MNKKGLFQYGLSITPILIVTAVFLLVFLSSGGAGTIYEITKLINKIPAFVWVILILIFLFRRRK